MRQLFLLMGTPTSGKSTFIKEHKLEDFTISSDEIRKLYLGSSIGYVNDEIGLTIDVDNHKMQKKVFQLIDKLVEKRLSFGVTTFVDATNINNKNRKRLLKIAKKYGCCTIVIPFGIRFDENRRSYSTMTLEELKERNYNRQFTVPDEVLERFYERSQKIALNNEYDIVYPEDFSLNLDVINVDKYKAIKVIGDIHSCGTALEETLKDFSDDVLYVFLGDYFDRGIETRKVLKVIEYLINKDNVVFLEGNHVRHIKHWLTDKKYTNRGFDKTKEDLKDSDYCLIKTLIEKMQLVKILQFHDNYFILSHAGFDDKQIMYEFDDKLQNKLLIRPADYFVYGIGGYNNDVDAKFDKAFKGTQFYQIHGHRNNYKHKITDFTNSFDLEQQVETGGKLGSVLITYDETKGKIKIEDTSVKNEIFDKTLDMKQ